MNGCLRFLHLAFLVLCIVVATPTLLYGAPSHAAHPADCPLAASTAMTPFDAAHPSATGISSLDFFTGGGSYMPRTHCLVTPEGKIDWPWIGALIVLTIGVICAYLRIFAFWVQSFRREEKRDRNRKLMDLAGIFLWCAICGYAMSLLMFVWPAYRLLAIFLVVLNIFSWKFVCNLEPFRLAFAANRLQRQLRESLEARAGELESLVQARTKEAEEARAAADAANRAKSEFLANMSHEIRTPLTAILGFSDVLCQSRDLPVGANDAARTISRQGQHLLAIINDILDLSKIESGQMSVERIATPLLQTLEETATLLRPRAIEKGLTLRVETVHPLPQQIFTDPTRLRQIVWNLLSNAVKFTERGEISLRISSTPGADPRHATVKMEITDTGIGISDEQAARLFRPFSQGDESTTRRFGGTGLGLSVSRCLARLLGGDLTYATTPGKGSTFTLLLNAEVCEQQWSSRAHPTLRSWTPPTDNPTPTRSFSDVNILMADDMPDNQRLVELVFSKEGAKVHKVCNGREAVDAALAALERGTPYDLILMDMQMPILDGHDASAELRRRGYTLPIVALTASAMSGERERCIAAGCDEYMTKPFNRSELVALCARLIAASSTGARG